VHPHRHRLQSLPLFRSVQASPIFWLMSTTTPDPRPIHHPLDPSTHGCTCCAALTLEASLHSKKWSYFTHPPRFVCLVALAERRRSKRQLGPVDDEAGSAKVVKLSNCQTASSKMVRIPEDSRHLQTCRPTLGLFRVARRSHLPQLPPNLRLSNDRRRQYGRPMGLGGIWTVMRLNGLCMQQHLVFFIFCFHIPTVYLSRQLLSWC